MDFVTLAIVPFISISLFRAAIPMMVSIHVARDVAARSVGEKAAPLPSLSTGASVMIFSHRNVYMGSFCS